MGIWTTIEQPRDGIIKGSIWRAQGTPCSTPVERRDGPRASPAPSYVTRISENVQPDNYVSQFLQDITFKLYVILKMQCSDNHLCLNPPLSPLNRSSSGVVSLTSVEAPRAGREIADQVLGAEIEPRGAVELGGAGADADVEGVAVVLVGKEGGGGVCVVLGLGATVAWISTQESRGGCGLKLTCRRGRREGRWRRQWMQWRRG